jgi:hypothetical protein
MTRSKLQRLIDRVPDSVLEGSGVEIDFGGNDLRELSEVVLALANTLSGVSREWMARQGLSWPEPTETRSWE